MQQINFFGETTFRNTRKKFGIKLDDRRRHMYIIGKTGMGKTALMENMAIQDILAGHGIGFVDPHGEAAEKLLNFIPSSRINDVVYFNPGDIDFPISFNVMEKVSFENRHLVASGLMGVFKKIWPDVWSARMEYILNNAILALLEYPGSTLLGVNRILADPDYRKKIVERIKDPVVKSFWVNEFARYTQRYEIEATAAIQNKIGQFISTPLIRNIVGQTKSSIDMRKIMDERKILIMNLSKGKIGEDNSLLLGSLLITKLQLAAMSRVDIPEEERQDFFLYVDEFQNFATESFINILSEARKYRLSLILGHQYIKQMEEKVRDAVFGNVGTIISFRVGADDAEYLEKEFYPEFTASDLVNLPKYHIYLKLMIDGVVGKPFSAKTLPPLPIPEKSNKDKIIKVSRERYGTPRKIVEEKIAAWSGAIESLSLSKSSLPQPQVLYNAKCSLCGKDTKVIFPPDGKKPVYCKGCIKKVNKNNRDYVKKEVKEKGSESISLKDIQKKSSSLPPKKQKKKVNIEELKKVLEDSLNKYKNENP
jgi:CxxC-x17-CxxC domain-containing protein